MNNTYLTTDYGNGNTRPNQNWGSNSSLNHGDLRQEEEMAMAIKKALTPEDAAPKQKHIRSIILYTWDSKGSGYLWDALKSYPMMGNEVVLFKALILYHKVLRQGHGSCLKDQYSNPSFLNDLKGMMAFRSGYYHELTLDYISFLNEKLLYHKSHPYFSGTFDYEEYVTLRGVEDPNDGYETITELLSLLDKIDKLQKHIFKDLRSTWRNEVRIAALVPLVEESDGIYKFINSMMTAMHTIIGSVEVLAPLRSECKQCHFKLQSFYDECSKLKYLTSLVQIPNIGHLPPDFLNQGPPTQKPKTAPTTVDTSRNEKEEREELERYERENRKRLEEQEYMKKREEELRLQEQQKLMEQQKRLQEQQRARDEENERMRQQQYLQQQQFQIQQQMMSAQQELEYHRQQSLKDRELLNKYDTKVRELQSELGNMSLMQANTSSVKALEDEIAKWKQKYETLTKLYGQLRKEHLDLLTKLKTIKDNELKVTNQSKQNTEELNTLLKKKADELTTVLVERNRLKEELGGIKGGYESEISRLRQELESTKKSLLEISQNQGDAVQKLVKDFQLDQSKLESTINSKQREITILTSQLGDVVSALEKSQMTFEQEKTMLQSSLDQALDLLKQHQMVSDTGISNRDERISALEAQHQQLLNGMMDNVLDTCIRTVSDQLFLLEGGETGRKIGAEYVMSLLELVNQKTTEFAASMVQLVNRGDPKSAIDSSASLAQAVAVLIRDGREVERFADEKVAKQILEWLKSGGESTIAFFKGTQSALISRVAPNERPNYIVNLSREIQMKFSGLTPLLESMVNKAELTGDVANQVELSMKAALEAVNAASIRIQDLLKSQGNFNVHSAILQAANAITSAIALLIKCATASQLEIASVGGQSAVSFYKKNSKWTQGLISAATSVSDATVGLVNYADGLVNNKASWEQVVVSAQDVGVCTTQLVAASRVKAALYSKTQEKLEHAAIQVRDCTKLLVKAAQDASQQSTEKQVDKNVGAMTKHEAKVKEMEQQVKILELEKELGAARYALGAMRRAGYKQE